MTRYNSDSWARGDREERMTRYNDDQWGLEGDFDDMLRGQDVLSYRKGVDRVLEYVESINAYPKLIAELKWAIDEGII